MPDEEVGGRVVALGVHPGCALGVIPLAIAIDPVVMDPVVVLVVQPVVIIIDPVVVLVVNEVVIVKSGSDLVAGGIHGGSICRRLSSRCFFLYLAL